MFYKLRLGIFCPGQSICSPDSDGFRGPVTEEWTAEDWPNVHRWLGSALQFIFGDFANLDSLHSAVPPLKWILVDVVSSRFAVFRCSCRPRSLRPASESAESAHLVSELGSMTPLNHAKVAKDGNALHAVNWSGEEGHCHHNFFLCLHAVMLCCFCYASKREWGNASLLLHHNLPFSFLSLPLGTPSILHRNRITVCYCTWLSLHYGKDLEIIVLQQGALVWQRGHDFRYFTLKKALVKCA